MGTSRGHVPRVHPPGLRLITHLGVTFNLERKMIGEAGDLPSQCCEDPTTMFGKFGRTGVKKRPLVAIEHGQPNTIAQQFHPQWLLVRHLRIVRQTLEHVLADATEDAQLDRRVGIVCPLGVRLIFLGSRIKDASGFFLRCGEGIAESPGYRVLDLRVL